MTVKKKTESVKLFFATLWAQMHSQRRHLVLDPVTVPCSHLLPQTDAMA
eukprot:COSAG02_NODE_1650_length_11487_cov_13.602895_16_plen_49_part_00